MKIGKSNRAGLRLGAGPVRLSARAADGVFLPGADLRIPDKKREKSVSSSKKGMEKCSYDLAERLLLRRFYQYMEEERATGRFSEKRYRLSMTLSRKLERYLRVFGLEDIETKNFGPEQAAAFGQFCAEEYRYACDPRYAAVYPRTFEACRSYPKRALKAESLQKLLNPFRCFWKDLVSFGEVPVSPYDAFRPEENRRRRYTELMGDPISLTRADFRCILHTPLPEEMASVRNAFLLQVCIGLRTKAFRTLAMDRIDVSPEGIPYLESDDMKIPLVRVAFDILLRNRRHFTPAACFGNRSWRKLLRCCGIEREVCVYDSRTGRSEYRALCDVFGRGHILRTHLDLLREADGQRGLRGPWYTGTKALKRLRQIPLAELFKRCNEAFSQTPYRTDVNLNILEGPPFAEQDVLQYARQPEKLPGGRTNPYLLSECRRGVPGQVELRYGATLCRSRKILVCGDRFADFMASVGEKHRGWIQCGLLLLKMVPDFRLSFVEALGDTVYLLRSMPRGYVYAIHFYLNGENIVLLDGRIEQKHGRPMRAGLPLSRIQALRRQHVAGALDTADYDAVLDAAFGAPATALREWSEMQACSRYVGQTLRQARKEAGIRQEDLLRRWGLKKDCGNLADAENGTRVLPFKYLRRYLEAVGCQALVVRPSLPGWNALSRQHTLVRMRQAAKAQ